VRLAFAVAAHLEPEILIVDEVLAVGDAQFQKKCLGKMKEVGGEGRTVLFVSHNMNAIEQLCESAILLDHGRVSAHSDDVRAVIDVYRKDVQDEGGLPEWVNAGEEFQNIFFKPLRFALLDEQGNLVRMPIRNDDDVWIEIEAEISQTDPALTVGYAIYSEDNHLLYWSYQTDQEEKHWPPLRRGTCRLRSRLPRRLLNEGTYRIELLASLHFRSWLIGSQKSGPSLGLSIQGGLSDSPLWIMKRPGLIAPVIPWVGTDVQQYDSEDERGVHIPESGELQFPDRSSGRLRGRMPG
jgi:lipopolysaccharide transport system ATP-binding protein